MGNSITKWFSLNASTVITLISWAGMAAFYVGIYKTRLDDLNKQIEYNRQTIKSTQLKHEELEKNIGSLEILKVNFEQSGRGIEKTFSTIDIRVARVEDAVSKIALLSQSIETLKESQKEMKDSQKEIRTDVKELKTLIETSLLKK